MTDLAWCPTCQERTVVDVGRPCAWCDTIVIRKRGGWKRPDMARRSRINRSQALALHAAHCHGLSLRRLATVTWTKLGYASEQSCLEGIRYAFKREGLRVRAQSEATAKANVERSTRLPGESKNEFKRRRRREHGYRDSRTGEWRLAGVLQANEETESSDALERP